MTHHLWMSHFVFYWDIQYKKRIFYWGNKYVYRANNTYYSSGYHFICNASRYGRDGDTKVDDDGHGISYYGSRGINIY